MLYPSTQDPADLAAATRAAEAEALAAAGTFGAALRASPEFTALLAADRALSEDADGERGDRGVRQPPGGAPGGDR